MNAVQEAQERAAKERTDRLYAEVRMIAPELYEHAVMIGSLVANKTGSTDFAAKVERMCMGLVSDAFNYALLAAVDAPKMKNEEPKL